MNEKKAAQPTEDQPQAPDGFSTSAYLVISIVILLLGILSAVAAWFTNQGAESTAQGSALSLAMLFIFFAVIFVGLAVTVFVFKIMGGVSASYEGGFFKGTLKLSGPIVILLLVMVWAYRFINPQQATRTINSQQSTGTIPTKLTTTFTVKFSMKLDPEPRISEGESLPNLSYKQNKPVPLEPERLAPISSGEYVVPRLPLPPLNQQYMAKIKRTENASIRGTPLDPTKLSFVRKSNLENGEYIAMFDCTEGNSCNLDDLADEGLFQIVDSTSTLGPRFFLIQSAYADDKSVPSGWIVPSLKTLRSQNEDRGISYTAFHIKANQLTGLEKVDSYTYEIYVNETPIYIDGWTKEDTLTPLDPKQGLEFQFGLENLNFSGADDGKERIKVVFDFYSAKSLLKNIEIERSYVALREVEQEEILKNGIVFDWTGKYVIGKTQDGFEVFIWSTPTGKGVAKRKKWFDLANVSREGQKAVSVIRPPLGKNLYGLAVGFIDDAGKIKFTFSHSEAERILTWVQKDLVTIRYDSHPIVRRDSYISDLQGLQ